ncbi:hypothetical protein AB0B50_02100 [Streptomyces sp. NPDC041068]|uniref:hypothetical protein n=1 Tax=Streptomyces sp. NPDC041068 TaxID=3155130 RepID=UPI0033E70B4C
MDTTTVVWLTVGGTLLGVFVGVAVTLGVQRWRSAPKAASGDKDSVRQSIIEFHGAMRELERLAATVVSPQRLSTVLKSELWRTGTALRFAANGDARTPEQVCKGAEAYADAVHAYVLANSERRSDGSKERLAKATRDMRRSRQEFTDVALARREPGGSTGP